MYSIAVSPLRQRAQQARTSPDNVAEEALRVYFGREEQAWQRAFEGLIAKVQARTMPFSPIEIEADITAAASEVRELRRARRRTDCDLQFAICDLPFAISAHLPASRTPAPP
jgi:hypothetical protein